MPKRAFLVGQAPSASSDPARAFSGHSGLKIAEMAGIDVERDDWYDELRKTFEPINLMPSYLGRKARGDVFTMSLGRQFALALKTEFAGSRFILVGSKVARCFNAPVYRCAWREHAGSWYALLPHPSGLNLWYNEPANVESARAFLRSEVERVRCQSKRPRAP